MIVRKLRLEKGWSQEQLAEVSGVSVRTIQRMERGKRVGLETLKCLAAVFETDVNTLQPETSMTTTDQGHLSEKERDAMVHVRDIKAFYAHLISYIIVMPILALGNLYYKAGTGVHAVRRYLEYFQREVLVRQLSRRLGSRACALLAASGGDDGTRQQDLPEPGV